MSSRLHGRVMRGGHHFQPHHRHGGHGPRGGGHWMPRVGSRGSRPDGYHRPSHSDRSPRPAMRHNDPEKLLESLGPDAQLAITTAIINTVLKSSDDKEPRGPIMRESRDHGFRPRDNRREGRGGFFKEEMRPPPPHRPYGEPRRFDRWHGERGRGGHHMEREKVNAGPPHHQYGNRYPPGPPKGRPSPHMHHQGPPYKRPRMDRFEVNELEREVRRGRRMMDGDGPEGRDQFRERPRRPSGVEEERSHRRQNEGMEDESGPSGVQVTIKADGERAVNSDGHVSRVGGRLFVELMCPHCDQKYITFKEYKMHLTSKYHIRRMRRLTKKHTFVLRKIQRHQRHEQREIENKWRDEKPEEFENAVKKYCSLCKLAFKCNGSNPGEGVIQHNRSKLHRMQHHYLHPRCGLCHKSFPRRKAYDRHVASVSHLRVRSAAMDDRGNNKPTDEDTKEDDDCELDLANFMTLDSVGDDDDEDGDGSDFEEIAGGDDLGSGDDNDDLESISGQSDLNIKEKDANGQAELKSEGKEVEEEEDIEWNKEQHEDEEEEGHKPLGTEYVRRIEAYYCSLCYKVIRANSSLGSRAVQRHCRSFSHLSHYRDHHPNLQQEDGTVSGEDGEGEPGKEGNQSKVWEEAAKDKLWEAFDKGLTDLEDVIMTEIEGEGEDAPEGSKEAEPPKKEKKEVTKNGDGGIKEEVKEETSNKEQNTKEKVVEEGKKDSKKKDSKAAEDWEEVGEDYSV